MKYALTILLILFSTIVEARMSLISFRESMTDPDTHKDTIATGRACGYSNVIDNYQFAFGEYLRICGVTDEQYDKIFGELESGTVQECSYLEKRIEVLKMITNIINRMRRSRDPDICDRVP